MLYCWLAEESPEATRFCVPDRHGLALFAGRASGAAMSAILNPMHVQIHNFEYGDVGAGTKSVPMTD